VGEISRSQNPVCFDCFVRGRSRIENTSKLRFAPTEIIECTCHSTLIEGRHSVLLDEIAKVEPSMLFIKGLHACSLCTCTAGDGTEDEGAQRQRKRRPDPQDQRRHLLSPHRTVIADRASLELTMEPVGFRTGKR
jgi:hypothetical protein